MSQCLNCGLLCGKIWNLKIEYHAHKNLSADSNNDTLIAGFVDLIGSTANSVGTTLQFTAFGSGPEAKLSRASAFCNESVLKLWTFVWKNLELKN